MSGALSQGEFRMRHRVKRAFTLVEILIVVVILGILAAIVVPQFTNASNEAQSGNVATQLQTIRSQVELYRVKNNGAYPPSLVAGGDGDTAWADLIGSDYLRAAPMNPRTHSTDVALGVDQDAGAATTGWVVSYDEDAQTFEIFAAFFDEVAYNEGLSDEHPSVWTGP
jgi:type II secretion system protein G